MILFYSDLHIRQERLEDCDTALKQIYDLAKKHNAVVVNGGDTFNTRGIIPTDALDLLYSHYKLWAENGISQIILAGNHDQQDKIGRVHPMRVFDFPSWVVVDEFYIHETLPIAFFNYMPKEKIQPYIEEAVAVLSKRCSDFYAVVHWGIAGAMMNDWVQDSDGVPVKWLKDFKMVFSGHYHYRNSFANIQYIGSPIQQNFAEKDQRKGVLLWNGESTEFIEITGTRMHYQIVVDDNEFCFNKVLHERDYLKVKATGNEKLNKEMFERFGTKNIIIERISEEVEQNRMNIKSEDIIHMDSLLNKYVDFKETDLSKERLIGIGKKILGGIG